MIQAFLSGLSDAVLRDPGGVSHLLLGGVEGQIPNIQSVALLQQLLLFIAVPLKTRETFKLSEIQHCSTRARVKVISFSLLLLRTQMKRYLDQSKVTQKQTSVGRPLCCLLTVANLLAINKSR